MVLEFTKKPNKQLWMNDEGEEFESDEPSKAKILLDRMRASIAKRLKRVHIVEKDYGLGLYQI
jgi:hypothetical protein